MKRTTSSARTAAETADAEWTPEELVSQSIVVPKGHNDGAEQLQDHSRALRAAKTPAEARGSMREPRKEAATLEIELFCPFDSGINAYADSVQADSVEWACRFGLVQSTAQRAKLDKSKIALLESLVFRTANRESLQLAADWTTLFCLLDDHVERDAWGPVDLSAYLARVLSDFRSGRLSAEDPIGEAFVDLRGRMLGLAGEKWCDRFGLQVENIFCGFIWEEINRRKGLRPGALAYREMRIDTVGLRPQFLLGELCEGAALSDELRSHPDVLRLEEAASRAVGWANDIFTCRRELRAGEVHNLVMVLMESERLPLADATRLAVASHDEEVRFFLATEARLLRSVVDRSGALSRYVEMLENWIRGHLDWSQETGRYNALQRSETLRSQV